MGGNNAAFVVCTSNGYVVSKGLTKREYLAGLALPALIEGGWDNPKETCEIAVEFADALLAALQPTLQQQVQDEDRQARQEGGAG